MTASDLPEFRSGCPIASSLDLVGDKWSLVIVRTLAFGPKTYAELLAMPERIATNILADRLRRMASWELIGAEGARRGPRYALTRTGAGLLPIVQALARWGSETLPDRWTVPDSFMTVDPEGFG